MPEPGSLEDIFHGLVNTRPERVAHAVAQWGDRSVNEAVFTGVLDGMERVWSASEAYTWGWCRRHLENRKQHDQASFHCKDPVSPMTYLRHLLVGTPPSDLAPPVLFAVQKEVFGTLRRYMRSKTGRRIAKRPADYQALPELLDTLASLVFGPVMADEGVLQKAQRLAYKHPAFAKAVKRAWDGADSQAMVEQSRWMTPEQGRGWLLFSLAAIDQANFDRDPVRAATTEAIVAALVYEGMMPVSLDPASTPHFPEEALSTVWQSRLMHRDLSQATIENNTPRQLTRM